MGVSRRKDRDGGSYWQIDYYFQGHRYRQKISRSKKDAENALASIRMKIAAGDFVPPKDRETPVEADVVTFKVFVESDLLPWSEGEHSSSHHSRLRLAFAKHLLPVFGTLPLPGITARQIEDYKTRRRRQGRSGRASEATINRELAALKLAFKKAVQWKMLEDNPAKSVPMYKETPDSPRLLEAGEVSCLLEQMPEELRALVSCAAYAGLRKGELQRLKWSDVDWNAGQLTVASRRGAHTKSYASRTVPLNNALAADLKRHPRVLGSDYVFANPQGKPYSNLRKPLKAAAQRAGIEGFVGLHQCRHAFCSHAIMGGVDPRTVQRWMGHKDLKTTLRYAHVSPDHEKAAIQRLSYGSGHQTVTSATG